MHSRKRKDYFTGCLPWPQKGTASFIADTGSLAVTTTAVNQTNSGYAYSLDSGDSGWLTASHTYKRGSAFLRPRQATSKVILTLTGMHN
jgi:hypothetical protein